MIFTHCLARIQALKKSVPKGDKKKKKDVTAQIAQLEQEVKERHNAELDEYNKVFISTGNYIVPCA